ncbi:MAG: hypothetical protein CMF50_10655 [Legionellales bacterium]|nr:hypothetical protein [Legionellales bacterium]|tara:strand:- start:2077 stop:4608 length:2532 start_codon:yes stop_codon:yes gene_type:complete
MYALTDDLLALLVNPQENLIPQNKQPNATLPDGLQVLQQFLIDCEQAKLKLSKKKVVINGKQELVPQNFKDEVLVTFQEALELLIFDYAYIEATNKGAQVSRRSSLKPQAAGDSQGMVGARNAARMLLDKVAGHEGLIKSAGDSSLSSLVRSKKTPLLQKADENTLIINRSLVALFMSVYCIIEQALHQSLSTFSSQEPLTQAIAKYKDAKSLEAKTAAKAEIIQLLLARVCHDKYPRKKTAYEEEYYAYVRRGNEWLARENVLTEFEARLSRIETLWEQQDIVDDHDPLLHSKTAILTVIGQIKQDIDKYKKNAKESGVLQFSVLEFVHNSRDTLKTFMKTMPSASHISNELYGGSVRLLKDIPGLVKIERESRSAIKLQYNRPRSGTGLEKLTNSTLRHSIQLSQGLDDTVRIAESADITPYDKHFKELYTVLKMVEVFYKRFVSLHDTLSDDKRRTLSKIFKNAELEDDKKFYVNNIARFNKLVKMLNTYDGIFKKCNLSQERLSSLSKQGMEHSKLARELIKLLLLMSLQELGVEYYGRSDVVKLLEELKISLAEKDLRQLIAEAKQQCAQLDSQMYLPTSISKASMTDSLDEGDDVVDKIYDTPAPQPQRTGAMQESREGGAEFLVGSGGGATEIQAEKAMAIGGEQPRHTRQLSHRGDNPVLVIQGSTPPPLPSRGNPKSDPRRESDAGTPPTSHTLTTRLEQANIDGSSASAETGAGGGSRDSVAQPLSGSGSASQLPSPPSSDDDVGAWKRVTQNSWTWKTAAGLEFFVGGGVIGTKVGVGLGLFTLGFSLSNPVTATIMFVAFALVVGAAITTLLAGSLTIKDGIQKCMSPSNS